MKDTEYEVRMSRIKKREKRMEELVLNALSTGEKQAWPIVDYVVSQMGDVPERMILRMIYRIMGINVNDIPSTRDNDFYIL
jgi:hypothetical protein